MATYEGLKIRPHIFQEAVTSHEHMYILHTSTAINIYFSAYFTDSLRGRRKIVMIHTYTYTDHVSNILGCRVYCTYILLLFQIYRLTGQFMISLTPVAYRLLSLVIFKLLTHLFMLLEKKINLA